MILRKAQLVALERHLRAAFITEMCDHLRKHFPACVSAIESRALSRRVEDALAYAGRYGLTTRRDLARYLNLAAAYGWGFDREPGHAWMRRILNDPEVSDPSARLQRLVAECLHRRALARTAQELTSRFEAKRT
jgi:hypothetical protein